jgi:rhodanese-related sulfurtransferase
MSRRRTSAARAAAVLLLASLLAGCAGIPDSGEVRVEEVPEQFEDEAAIDFAPGGPRPGAPALEVVRGFLVAMQATPLSTSAARQFLTTASSETWVPERGTLVYDEETRSAVGDEVRLELEDTIRLDRRGRWLGRGGDVTYDLRLVREDGEWRIEEPPDVLAIPLDHFESRFAQFSLHYFDKTAQVLVPEPVHVPTGPQATTFLVQGLLAGPGRDLLGVERTFLPAGTRLDDISVPVGEDGTAEVPLSDEVLDATDVELARAFAQLAWTLDQVPGVEQIRVTVDGSPLELPGLGSELAVGAWSEYDPAVAWASESLFGVREARVVTFDGEREQRVSGPFGSLDLGVERVGLDLLAERVAATTADGSVLVGPRARRIGVAPTPDDVRTVLTGGADLLRPAWDLHGGLWLVDRPADGAVVRVREGEELRTVAVPGVTGQDVRAFELSRDGTRVVAWIDDGGRQRLVVARVQRGTKGAVRAVTPAEPIALGPLGRPVRDLAWRTPAGLAVLTAPTEVSSRVVAVEIDGSSAVGDALPDVQVFGGAADRVVTGPAVGTPLYLQTPSGQTFELAVTGRWTGAGIPAGLESPTFVG